MEKYIEAKDFLKETFRKMVFNGYDPLSQSENERKVTGDFFTLLTDAFGVEKIQSSSDLVAKLDEYESKEIKKPEDLNMDIDMMLQLAVDNLPALYNIPEQKLKRVGELLLTDLVFLETLFVNVGLNNAWIQKEFNIDPYVPTWRDILTRLFFENRNIFKDLSAPEEFNIISDEILVSFYIDKTFNKNTHAGIIGFLENKELKRQFENGLILIPGLYNYLAQHFIEPGIYSRYNFDMTNLSQVQYYIFFRTITELLVLGIMGSDSCNIILTKMYLLLSAISRSHDITNDNSLSWEYDAEILGNLEKFSIDEKVLSNEPYSNLNHVNYNFMRSVMSLAVNESEFFDYSMKIPYRYGGSVEVLNSIQQKCLQKGADKLRYISYLKNIYKKFSESVDNYLTGINERDVLVLGENIPVMTYIKADHISRIDESKKYNLLGKIGEYKISVQIETVFVESERNIILDLKMDLENPSDFYNLDVGMFINYYGGKKLIQSKHIRKNNFSENYRLDPMLHLLYSIEVFDNASDESLILFSVEY